MERNNEANTVEVEVDFMAQFEAGELDDDDVIEGFQHMLDTGLINQLGRHYCRTAKNLLDAGLIEQRPAPRVN